MVGFDTWNVFVWAFKGFEYTSKHIKTVIFQRNCCYMDYIEECLIIYIYIYIYIYWYTYVYTYYEVIVFLYVGMNICLFDFFRNVEVPQTEVDCHVCVCVLFNNLCIIQILFHYAVIHFTDNCCFTCIT